LLFFLNSGSLSCWLNSFACCWRREEKQTTAIDGVCDGALEMITYPLDDQAVIITDMNKYIDIGVNLTGSSFKKDVANVIERAQQVGVKQMVVTGTNLLHSEHAIQLAEQYESTCYATVGLHPHDAGDYSSDTLSELRDMLQRKNVVAVGECGLDYNRNFSSRKDQIRAFEAQLELAIELQKPLFLHQRDAHEDLVSMLKSC